MTAGDSIRTSGSQFILNTSPSTKVGMEREKFLPGVDREGKTLGEPDYTIPSPPERDTSHLDLGFTKFSETRLSQLSIDGGYDGSQSSLTRAELEQYSRAYEEVRPPSHSQQPSYAQSEGYHSYVSSADSTLTATPFLDRLRRESETGRESASSGSSSETLKWHGSLSDVSSTPQHIVHSARVAQPQRHHSESVLYLEPPPSVATTPASLHQQQTNNRRLFPVSTYEPTAPRYILGGSERAPPKLSVAERICEIERRGGGSSEEKRRSCGGGSGPGSGGLTTDHASLKAIQKKALLSFYERHASAWKSEPQLTAPSIPPQPPPRPPPAASVQPPPPPPAAAGRRSSSASDFSAPGKREVSRSSLENSKVEMNGMRDLKHQHSSSCGSLTSSSLGPMIIGPSISVDDWVPARPPKKPHLRAAYPPPPPVSPEQRPPAAPPSTVTPASRPPPEPTTPRPPSPELPPPSPPPPPDAESYPDEPLPPPPPEIQRVPSDLSAPAYPRSYQERAMNASISLDNLTRSEKPPYNRAKSNDYNNDAYYENGTEIRRNESIKNGFSYSDKFNERFVENRIESLQSSYCDHMNDFWDKKSYLDLRRCTEKKQLESQVRHNLLSPPLPSKKRSHSEQPRSLDSNLSLVEANNEVNRPGPQTPTHKKYSGQMSINGHEKQMSYKNFMRASSVPHENNMVKNIPERQSLRFTTATQKLLINGKIANAVHNGKISPPSRKANLVRTPSDVIRPSSGIHHAEPLMKRAEPMMMHAEPIHRHPEPMRHADHIMRHTEPLHRHLEGVGRHSESPLRHSEAGSRQPEHVLRHADSHHHRHPEPMAGRPPSEASALRHPPGGSPLRQPEPVARHTEPLHRHAELMVRHAEPVRKPPEVILHHAEPLGRPPELQQRPALPPHCPPTTLQLSQSKASYLSYKREPKEKEKGLPNFQGSYKRTMSPSGGRLIEATIDKSLEIVTPTDEKAREECKRRDEERGEKCEGETERREMPEDPADREAASKTLPRGYPVPVKTRGRPPRAQSDPTCSAKLEKKTISTSTQDNLEEEKSGCGVVVVGRSQSERTAESSGRRGAASLEMEPRVSDASSQTTPSPSPPPPPPPAPASTAAGAGVTTPAGLSPPPRRQFQEEIECDRLSRDLASQLSPSHKLHGILVPGPEVKRTTDYVSGLFRMDFAPRAKPTVAAVPAPAASSPPPPLSPTEPPALPNLPSSTQTTTQASSQTNGFLEETETPAKITGNEDESHPTTNTTFTNTECKARLLPSNPSSTPGPEATPALPPPPSIGSLQQKKEELMLRLTRKLSVLRAESVAVTEETALNEALGVAVSERVARVARPHEVSRYRLHVMEVGHITSLLLSLSARLARAENALLALSPDHQDRKSLEEKRDKLLSQLNEAKELKSSIDARSGSVSTMLYNYLTGDEYTDYDHFINMKSKLLVDSREIAEKIQLGEEQLAALKETLDQVR